MKIKPRKRKSPKNSNGDNRNEADCVTYLGVLIDDNLAWKQHTQHVNTKIAKSSGIMAKMRRFAPKNIQLSAMPSSYVHISIMESVTVEEPNQTC